MCEKTENEMFAQIEPLITISFQEALNCRSPARFRQSRKEPTAAHRNFVADLFANGFAVNGAMGETPKIYEP